ncbi:MAG: hypothetical protein IJT25_02215 [Clostridia bacterium]|nr:hypothetical protein [Clostridia bacterium]
MKLTKKLVLIVCVMLVTTLVSFSVIGTTYAKYVSGIYSHSEIQAAGFLIQGETPANATIEGSTKIAPGESATINVPIVYFSQVPTSFRTASNVHLVGFGALADFDLLTTEFEGYKARLGKYGITPTSLSQSFSITFGNSVDVCSEMITLLRAEGLRLMTPEDSTFTDPIISPMSASATSALHLTMPITITWINHATKTWDAWDTFLGEKFYQSNVASGVQIKLELVAEQYQGEVS